MPRFRPCLKTLYSPLLTNQPREADMHGKVVVITGATSGIGEIAAGRLAQQGARLLLVARDPRRPGMSRYSVASIRGIASTRPISRLRK